MIDGCTTVQNICISLNPLLTPFFTFTSSNKHPLYTFNRAKNTFSIASLHHLLYRTKLFHDAPPVTSSSPPSPQGKKKKRKSTNMLLNSFLTILVLPAILFLSSHTILLLASASATPLIFVGSTGGNVTINGNGNVTANNVDIQFLDCSSNRFLLACPGPGPEVCVDQSQLCDGVSDCPKGKDELPALCAALDLGEFLVFFVRFVCWVCDVRVCEGNKSTRGK